MASLPADTTLLYHYSPLPSKTSIRLLQLQSSENGSTISCSMSIIDALENSPSYDALSYTWGNPQSPFSRSYDEPNVTYNSNTIPIMCNGRRIVVTPNLRDALQMLLETQTPGTDQIYSNRHDYIWVDALCINQADIAERNAQVSLMDELFKRAQNVYAWIGQEDEFTEDAMTVMDRLSSIPKHLYNTVTQNDFTDPEAYGSKLGILPLELSNWLGWIAFLHRPYFQRSWIVQEVSLATNLVMVVGKRKFAWDTLSTAISFLTPSVWSVLLHSEYLRTKVVTGMKPEKYQKLLAVNIDPGFGAMYLNQTKTTAALAGKFYSFGQLLKNHRYSMLGVSRKEGKPFTTHPEAVLPDYGLPVQTLYTRVTRVLLQSYEDLKFLSDIESRPMLTNVKGLPSWVPDYSAVLQPNPLSNRAPEANWNAERDLIWRPGTRALEDSLLDVQGIHVGTVVEVSLSMINLSVPVEVYWARICGVALGLNERYAVSQD
jgi:Heterokaryon incompatibility protein (HET)